MLSSAGSVISPQRRPALWLAAIALAALAVSLVLAFAAAPPQRSGANGDDALRTTAQSGSNPRVAPTPALPASTLARSDANLPSLAEKPPLLWTLLAPWAIAADVLAVLGLAAVLAVRHAQRRRGARR